MVHSKIISLDNKTHVDDILHHLLKLNIPLSEKKLIIYTGIIGANLRDDEGNRMFLNNLNYKMANHNTTLFVIGDRHKDIYSNIIFMLR